MNSRPPLEVEHGRMKTAALARFGVEVKDGATLLNLGGAAYVRHGGSWLLLDAGKHGYNVRDDEGETLRDAAQLDDEPAARRAEEAESSRREPVHTEAIRDFYDDPPERYVPTQDEL